MTRQKEPSSYPQGPRTITLKLTEQGWETLHSAIGVRIRWFEQRIAEISRNQDPDEVAHILQWYEDSLEILRKTQRSLEDQIDRDFFAKKRV